MSKIPIAILTYNRPDATASCVKAISRVAPDHIYIVADGPKTSSDKALCEKARKAAEDINWKCNITKIYSNKNLGLQRRVVSGINQILKKEKWIIVIEDDCIAHPDFFRYAEEMLVRYENNKQIIGVGGYNQFPEPKMKDSYYFTKYIESWGWATWSRAWVNYDDKMMGWNAKKKRGWLKLFLPNHTLVSYWENTFDLTSNNYFDTWAYRWLYSAWGIGGLTVIPKVNLISNIGFGVSATHTKRKIPIVKTSSLKFPLNHPVHIKINSKIESRIEKILANQHQSKLRRLYILVTLLGKTISFRLGNFFK